MAAPSDRFIYKLPPKALLWQTELRRFYEILNYKAFIIS